MISAAAPSLTPEALPAVTVPSLRTIGFSLAERFEAGQRADARRVSTMIGSPLRCGIVDRRRSRRRGGHWPAPRRCARWLRSGERVLVLAADLIFLGDILGRLGHGVVAISASRIFGLTKRQPMVVS